MSGTSRNTGRNTSMHANGRVVFKTLFDTPHGQWPTDGILDAAVFNRLLILLGAHVAARGGRIASSGSLPGGTGRRRYRRGADRREPEPEPVPEPVLVPPEEAMAKRPRVDTTRGDGGPPDTLRLCVGLNEVTRALETRRLAVAIACNADASHAHLLRHIPFQCMLANAMLLTAPKGSAGELGRLFHARCPSTREQTPAVLIMGILAGGSNGSAGDVHLAEATALARQQVPRQMQQSAAARTTYQSLAVRRLPSSMNPRKQKEKKEKKGQSEQMKPTEQEEQEHARGTDAEAKDPADMADC